MHTFLKICGKYEPEVADILYHYCSVDTMLKIIQNHCIWLSDVEKTNDKSELKYFAKQMEKMLLNIIESYRGQVNEEKLTKIKIVLQEAIKRVYLGTAYVVQMTKNYVCCFSEKSDLLSQWRAYGNDGQGVAIGFNTKLLSKIHDRSNYDFIKIIYNDKTVLKNIQEYMEEELKNIFENITEDELTRDGIMGYFMTIMTVIVQERFAFKHPAFSEEGEWRIFRKQVGNFDEDTGEDEPLFHGAFHADDEIFGLFSCSDLKFRSLQNNICSYYELGFEKCKEDIIKEIILGPKCQIEKRDLKILLRKYMYISDVESERIEIKKSEIPYV